MGLEALKMGFIDLIPDPVVVGHVAPGDDTVRFAYVNPAFITQFGHQPADVLGQDIALFTKTGTWAPHMPEAPLASAAASSGRAPHVPIRSADGTTFWCDLSFFSHADETDGGHFICATCHNIKDHKEDRIPLQSALEQTQDVLAAKIKRLQKLEMNQMRLFSSMNAYPEPLAIYDENKRISFWNNAFAETVANSPKDIKPGMTADEIFQLGQRSGKLAQDHCDLPQWIAPAPEETYQNYAIEVEVDGGIYRHVLRHQTAHGDHVIMCQDTSAAIRERQAADQERSRLVDALNAYPEPIVIYDRDLNLVAWNEAYAASIVIDTDKLEVGMSLRSVLEIASKTGAFENAIGREDEWIEGIMAEVSLNTPLEDVEMAGDIHCRLTRSRSPNGDYVVIRMNTTEFVRQKRKAEAVQTRLIAALNAYPSPFAIYDADERLVVWNNAYRASMTNDPEKLREGMSVYEVTRQAVEEGKIASAKGREEDWLTDKLDKKRAEIAVEDIELEGDIHHRLLRSRAENGDLMILRIDTTELVRQRRTLEVAQNRLISAINSYPDPFAIYDADQNLLIWNPAYARSMATDPDEVKQGMNLKDLLLLAAFAGKLSDAKGREHEWVENYYSSDTLAPGIEDFEFGNDQHYRMVRSRAANGESVVLRINITEVVRQRRAVEEYAHKLEAANHEITHKALHDELTGLGNRRFLSEKFDAFVKRRDQHGGEIAALHIDLDRFKQINDTMGHTAGDEVLRDTAKRICSHTRNDEVVARIGGDEFVVLIFVTDDHTRPQRLAKTLIEDLTRPTIFEGKECRFGASIGLARTPLAEVDELLTNSDVALYKAKNAGRGQLGVFDRTDLEEVRRNKALADDVLRAIECSEFIPFYQPQVDANTGEMVGMEALARWQHPTKGILAPYAFLDMATDLNVAADIDRMIFEKAIVECQKGFGHWEKPPSLSFNVSAKRVQEGKFDTIRDYVESYSGQVCFELLETIFLEEEDTAFLFHLDRLRELGIEIEVDDFGSGRASVVALQRIGPDRVKIDRRLIAPVTESSSGLRLTRSIVEIGCALGIGVTAEGVETREQADILAELGCDTLQGFYFAKPMAFDDVMNFVYTRAEDAHRCPPRTAVGK